MYTGIDLGLNNTSIVTLNEKGKVIHQIQFGAEINEEMKRAIKFNYHIARRHNLYFEAFCEYFKENNIYGKVLMEDPRGSFAGSAIRLAEMKGYYLIALLNFFHWENIHLLGASQIKKKFTDDGAASKDKMIAYAKRRGFYASSTHLADAFACAWIVSKL